MRKLLFGAMVALLMVSTLAVTLRIPLTKSSPGTITVPDDYPTIQAAINAASPGDEVDVRAGTYYENIIVNKTVSLLGSGEQTTTIFGSGSGSVIVLTANNTSIEGFAIRHGRSMNNISDLNYFGSGIDVVSSLNTIANNKIIDCNDGVGLWYEHGNNILINNIFQDNLYGGILFAECCGNYLRNNTMEYHKTRDILHTMQFLGHKNIKNTLIYTQLVKFQESDDFHGATAKTAEEAKKLVESGFDYVCTTPEALMLFRKRK